MDRKHSQSDLRRRANGCGTPTGHNGRARPGVTSCPAVRTLQLDRILIDEAQKHSHT